MAGLFDFRARMVIIGDTAVGKTRMLFRFLNKNVDPLPTTTASFFPYETFLRGKSVAFYFWDTASHQRLYYTRVVGAMVVYDITNRESFKHARQWLKELREKSTGEDMVIMLIGNKSDLEENRVVTTLEGMEFAVKERISNFTETSATDDESVPAAFKLMLEKMMDIEVKKRLKMLGLTAQQHTFV